MSSGFIVFLEGSLVLGLVLVFAFMELRSLRRADKKAEQQASAAASRHAEGKEHLDPPGGESV